jgi:hypothetical protein
MHQIPIDPGTTAFMTDVAHTPPTPAGTVSVGQTIREPSTCSGASRLEVATHGHSTLLGLNERDARTSLSVLASGVGEYG